MELNREEYRVLRSLAETYMELASLPVQAEKAAMWQSLNDGHMERPMVAIDQLPWNELEEDSFLRCVVRPPYWRGVEETLRRAIYQYRHFPVDMVLPPYVLLPRLLHGLDYGDYGVKIVRETRRTDAANDVVSSRFVNQLETWDDLEKIQAPPVWEDLAGEAALREQAEALFAGVAPFRFRGHTLHLGVWDFIAHWMGVENVYIALMDEPEFLHAIMERVVRETEKKIRALNDLRAYDALSGMCHCSYTFSTDLPGADCQRDAPLSGDVWAMGLAQLFTSVSPQVTAEFEAAYMQRLFPYFGAIYYGCCDRLDDRLDVVETLPNVRKVSCSPWSQRERFAERLNRRYVMSNKPTPAFLAAQTVEWDVVRADLRRTVEAARRNGTRLELILKDLSTVRYDPSRLTRWGEIALEEVARLD